MFVVFGCLTAHAATPLTESVFTEIINDAKVVAASTQVATPARTSELFKAPDLVRTGPASRVELTAADSTITRIGANTVFTFESSGRTIDLEKGSIPSIRRRAKAAASSNTAAPPQPSSARPLSSPSSPTAVSKSWCWKANAS